MSLTSWNDENFIDVRSREHGWSVIPIFEEWDDPRWEAWASVKRPSRYVGGEWGDVKPKDDASVRICLCFPDVYEVGMSYLGFQILYTMIKALDSIDVERAYCPWVDMEEIMRARKIPLGSIESNRPFKDFHVLGFTLQYELSFSNILTMLNLGGIPLRVADRDDRDPLVIAGGPGALSPEPLADFIDIFCLGDGEVMLPPLLRLISETVGMDRSRRLAMASAIPGVYVPSMVRWTYDERGASWSGNGVPVQRVVAPDMDVICPETVIVPSAGILHDRVAVEVFRGCSRGCRFCQAGMIYRPVRERSPEMVLDTVRRLSEASGWEEISLVSLASCDYSHIQRTILELGPYLEERGMKLSLPSLRMDNFALSLAAGLEIMKKSGLTLAPEGGTQRIRDVINKGVTQDNVRETLQAAFEHGWDRIKLYFMMGLPTETEEDLAGILQIAEDAVRIGRSMKRKAQVTVSVAGFVPKPHTPFQWEAQDTIESFRSKGRWLKGHVRNRKISLKYHEPDQSFLEGVFARGDRRLGTVILRAWTLGARFDGWSDTFSLERWLRAFDDCSVDPGRYNLRERNQNEMFPWDHIDVGVTRDFLWRERCRSREGRITPDCRGGTCCACGWQDRGCLWAKRDR